MKKVVFLLAITGYLASCTNDSIEELHPAKAVCDTTGVISFANDIIPIMNLQCGTDNVACHVNPAADGGCGFANYVDMLDYLASSSKDIKFVKTITHDPTLTSSLYMPKGSSTKIDDCSIQKIQAWINRGKLNN